MRRKDRFSPPPTGGISLLTVFAVLSLTVFALLSLSTVQANGRLADASVGAVESCYAADRAAQEVLARLRGGERPAGVTADGDIYRYSCPISDTQTLEVEVRIVGSGYTILRWQAAPAGTWEPDDGPEVWDGTLF